MRNAVIHTLLIAQIVSILALAGTAGAAPPGELVSVTYTYSSGSDQLLDGYLLSSQNSKTVSFSVGPKPGKVIKDLAWYDLNGNRIRAAQGDWLNKASFSTTSEPIQGTPLDVKSISTSPYSGIYFWDRSGGSNEWRAGHSGKTVSSNNCPPLSEKDEWGLRAYPNCTDMVNQPVPITAPYFVQTIGPLHENQINANVVDVHTIDSYVTVNEKEFNYTSPHGKTVAAQAFEYQFSNIKHAWAPSSTEVVVTFDHYSGPESWQLGYYQDWANPGARQMWYFFNFDVTVTGKTYLYRDKQLYVVWGDADYDITGDFDILPSNTINYKDTFTLKPKNFVIPSGCTYQYHEYRIQKGDAIWIGGRTTSQTASVSFSYGHYPNVIGIGNHEVSIRITADCPTGTVDTGWIATKMLVVKSGGFSGDFDVLPPVIEYREPFQLKPKNFVFNGCTYDGHRYKIERDGSTVYTSWASGQSQIHSYAYSNYPWIIGIGTHTITLEIRTKECGTEQTAEHMLVVKGPSNNHPPEFEIGFVLPSNPTKPVYEVVEGTVMHLIYIEDPSVPTPYDPDGDAIEFLGFDFSSSSSWAKTIPQISSQYSNGYYNITMNGLGYHAVKATMRDAFGATTTRTSYINVIPSNPIPVIEGPKEVKEGRPLPEPFSSAKSYSPAGRTIDHSRDEWGNMKDVYTTPGKEIITLHVTDSSGLRSLEPARHELTVLPDEPPLAKLEIEPLGIREQTYHVFNKSESLDGDKLVSAEYKMRYDDENNGFDDDPWVELAGDMTRAAFKPNRVGKYQFYVKVCEDYGKCDDTLSEPVEQTMINILNLAPEVSFRMEGSNPQPDLSPEQIYTAATMQEWTLTEVNSTVALPGKAIRWRVEDGELRGLLGKKQERLRGSYYAYEYWGNTNYREWFHPLSDLGYGANGLSPYRPIQKTMSPHSGQPILIPENVDGTVEWKVLTFTHEKPMKYTTTNTHMYFAAQDKFFALNKSKVGMYQTQVVNKNGDQVLTHLLPGGSYYDYIIEPPFNGENIQYYAKVLPENANGEWEFFRQDERPANAQLCPLSLKGVRGYYWTDNAVYMMAEFSGNCRAISGGGLSSVTFITTQTFDIKTGQFLASSLDHGGSDVGIPMPFSTQRGKDIVFFRNIGNNGLEAVRVSPGAEVVSRKELSRPAADQACRPSSAGESFIYEGIDQDLYVYDQMMCFNANGTRNTALESAYVTKYDENFDVVWRVRLQGKHVGPYQKYLYNEAPGNMEVMIVNPLRNEIVTRSYTPNGNGLLEYTQAFDMTTGAEKPFDVSQYTFSWYSVNFGIDWSGDYYTMVSGQLRLSTSAYGNLRTLSGGDRHYTYYPTRQQAHPYFSSGGEHYFISIRGFGYQHSTNALLYGEYVGDGLFLSIFNNRSAGPGYSQVQMGTWVPWLNVGTPSEVPKIGSGMTLGQLMSDADISDHELSFSLAIEDADADRELAGLSFRAADAANRYALETDGAALYLSKYENGTRTVLAQTNYPFRNEERVHLRVRAAGSQLEVYVNGAPYFSVTDETYGSGKFGPFSDKPRVRFSYLKTKAVRPQETVWDTAYAIWEEGSAKAEARYSDIEFADPENDPPAGVYDWTVEHEPRFLNNQGLSSLHGRTFASQVPEFDKVGDYTVLLRAKDDPHPEYPFPDMTFDVYRKPSNAFAATITVHRRPIADKSHSIAADGTVLWVDRSHDPDRWISSTEYSTEPTGIDYGTTRGILEKKFYYITPSGRYVAEKLVVPVELGWYEVGMAVKDEYGAWSEYDVDYVTITQLPEPNEPPHAGFTLSMASTYRGAAITIDSTAWDKEDGDRTNLPHEYYIAATDGAEALASASRTSWTKAFGTVGTFRIRQVVTDSLGQTDQAIQTVTVLNRKPQANVTTPASADPASPTRFDVLRPVFSWGYADADGDAQTMFQVQIYRANGTLERDTGPRSGTVTNWTPAADLPEKADMYVRVRVFDGYDWSDWSAPKYFRIETNRPPAADFDWTPKPVYEGDTVRLIDRSSDPDGDSLSYEWQIAGPDGGVLGFAVKEPSFRAALPGSHAIRLTVSDGRLTAQATRTMEVLPLTIAGEVHHTPEWREIHAAAGHEVGHDPKEFYSGEIIRVAAVISDAPAIEVTAELRAVSKTGDPIRKKVTLTSAGGQRYEGELHDASWMSLDEGIREGAHTVVFQVRYQNGVTKEASVPIRIIGNLYRAVSVHRVQ